MADDHPLVRRSIVDLLDRTDDISVVTQCQDGTEVLAAVDRFHPDVALLDVRMPGTSGLEAARAVCASTLTRVLMLTGSWSRALVQEAADAGVSGYVLKGDDPLRLPDLVRRVAAGGSAWDSVGHPETPRPS